MFKHAVITKILNHTELRWTTTANSLTLTSNNRIYANKLEVSEIEDTLTEKYISNFNNTEKVIVKTDESHITVTEVFFMTNDYHILLKEGARLFSENNTFFGSRFGAIAFDEPRHDVECLKELCFQEIYFMITR